MNIMWLDAITRKDLAAVGGKAANLGELVNLGIPVPHGFCITTQAFLDQIMEWHLPQTIGPMLQRHDWDGVSRVAEDVCTNMPISPELKFELLQAYGRLGGTIAVRSSASSEDLVGVSAAGQHDTFLNVKGTDEFLNTVRRCWASLWNLRALVYRHQRGISNVDISMAVVAQRMVPADSVGVMFTKDPTPNRAGSMIVEAAFGLGDVVVSGSAETDRYHLSGDGSSVVESEIRNPNKPVMTMEQLLLLGRIGQTLESHFGHPQDVEFAVVDGRLQILQTRDVSTLFHPQPEEIPRLGRLSFFQRLCSDRFQERYHIAPKPLDNLAVSIVMHASVRALRILGLGFLDRSVDRLTQQYWREGLTLPNPFPTWRLVKSPGYLKHLWSQDLISWWEEEPRRRLIDCSQAVDPVNASNEELFARSDHTRNVWLEVMTERLQITFSIYVLNWLLRMLLHLSVGHRHISRTLADLLVGLSTKTAEINQALWELSMAARRVPEISRLIEEDDVESIHTVTGGEAFLRKFRAYLDDYGHREGTTWYLWTPTWRQEPKQVWTILRGLLKVRSLPEASDWERYDIAVGNVERGLRYWPGLRRLSRWVIQRFRSLHVFEDVSHFDLTRPLDVLQVLSAEWGRRLVQKELLSSAGDVYLLTYDEVREWLSRQPPTPSEARKTIMRRRTTYTAASSRWKTRQLPAKIPSKILVGIPASHGTASGNARIILNERDFHRLLPGEILVCPHTSPSWTPLFVLAAGIVTEAGGVTSHAAIIAREYGIPAIVGVSGATQFILDGQELLADGNTGRVVLVTRLEHP